MAATVRGPRACMTDHDGYGELVQRILDEPEGFEVFQAAAILEDVAARYAKAQGVASPPEIGGHAKGAGIRDSVRFASATSLSFPGGAITQAELIQSPYPHSPGATGTQGGRFRLEISSFGLLGPTGVLPKHYTVLVNERLRRFRDKAVRDFLDIFSHRATSLLVRAWRKYRPIAQRWRFKRLGLGVNWADSVQTREAVAAVIMSVLGLGGGSHSGKLKVPESTLMYHAGILARHPAAALPLEQLIRNVWGESVQVEQFVGRWLNLDCDDQTQINCVKPMNARLGIDALVGKRVWSVEASYIVRLGPMPWAAFVQWLPGSEKLEQLSDLLRFHVGPALESTVQPILQASDVPRMQLSGDGGQLGWTTWLVTKQPTRDADDAAFVVSVPCSV